MIKEGDLCEKGCIHSKNNQKPKVCNEWGRCLHLMVSSGRYTKINGNHRRVPFGCYKIGRIASSEYSSFITNDVTNDPQVHDHEWARNNGLVSFAGYRLLSKDGYPIGVLALFSKHPLGANHEKMLEDLANTTSQVIIAGLAEQALMESEGKFRELSDMSPAAIIVYHGNSIVYTNDYTSKMAGYTKEELKNMNFWDIFHPDFIEMVKKRGIARQRGEKVPERYEIKYIKKSGETRWADISARRIIYEGKPAGMAMLVDITNRKIAEKALKESENLYRTIFNNTGAATIIIGPDTTIILANYGWEKLTGVSKEEQENRTSWTIYIHEDDVERMKAFHYARRNDPSLAPNIYECRVVDAKKEVHDCIVHVDIIPGTQNSVASLIDVTELKKTEKALSESEKKYRALYEDNPSMYFTVDVGGVLHSVNQYGCEQLGYMSEELIGKSFLKLFQEKDKETALNSLKICASNLGEVFHWEICKVRKDGSVIWVKDSARAIRKNNGNIVIFIVSEDVTERKQAEDKLKDSLCEKEVLLREIHHRVKNNMQIISSLLSLQSKYVKDIKDKELFEESRNRVRSMAIIHEKVYQSEDLSNINFSTYLPEVVYSISNYYMLHHRINILVDVEDVSLNIETAIPCGLIVNELLTNSLKHAFPNKRHGNVEIKLCTDESGEITLIVRDDGVGFPEGIDFEKTESLGLRLVDVLMKQLGGTINVNYGDGTEFRMIFREFETLKHQIPSIR